MGQRVRRPAPMWRAREERIRNIEERYDEFSPNLIQSLAKEYEMQEAL